MKKEALKIIDASQVPEKKQTRTDEWIALLKGIQKGKAVEGTTKTLGARETVANILRTYTAKKLIPKGYRVAQRKVGDEVRIYIIRDADSSAKESQ